jgi:hypothetical protein
MTDEIRRAYDEWLETDEGVQRGLELNSAYREWMSHAWQAACEYRDKYWQEKVEEAESSYAGAMADLDANKQESE